MFGKYLPAQPDLHTASNDPSSRNSKYTGIVPRHVFIKDPLGHLEKHDSLSKKWVLDFAWLSFNPTDNFRTHRLQFMNEDLTTLLQLKHYVFWSNVVFDTSFARFLDSFLLYSARSFTLQAPSQEFYHDNQIENLSNQKVYLSPMLKTLLRNFLAVALRIFAPSESNEEGWAEFDPSSIKSPSGSISQTHADFVYQIFDFPKFVDFVTIFAQFNLSLVKHISSHLFTIQPNYQKDLIMTIKAANRSILLASSKLSKSLQTFQNQPKIKNEVMDNNRNEANDNKLLEESKLTETKNQLSFQSILDQCEDMAHYIQELTQTLSRLCKVFSPQVISQCTTLISLTENAPSQSSLTNKNETINIQNEKSKDCDNSTNTDDIELTQTGSLFSVLNFAMRSFVPTLLECISSGNQQFKSEETSFVDISTSQLSHEASAVGKSGYSKLLQTSRQIISILNKFISASISIIESSTEIQFGQLSREAEKLNSFLQILVSKNSALIAAVAPNASDSFSKNISYLISSNDDRTISMASSSSAQNSSETSLTEEALLIVQILQSKYNLMNKLELVKLKLESYVNLNAGVKGSIFKLIEQLKQIESSRLQKQTNSSSHKQKSRSKSSSNNSSNKIWQEAQEKVKDVGEILNLDFKSEASPSLAYLTFAYIKAFGNDPQRLMNWMLEGRSESQKELQGISIRISEREARRILFPKANNQSSASRGGLVKSRSGDNGLKGSRNGSSTLYDDDDDHSGNDSDQFDDDHLVSDHDRMLYEKLKEEDEKRFAKWKNQQSSTNPSNDAFMFSNKKSNKKNKTISYMEAFEMDKKARELQAEQTMKLLKLQEEADETREYDTQLKRARGQFVDEDAEDLFIQLRASEELRMSIEMRRSENLKNSEFGGVSYDDEPDDSLDDFHPSSLNQRDNDNDSGLQVLKKKNIQHQNNESYRHSGSSSSSSIKKKQHEEIVEDGDKNDTNNANTNRYGARYFGAVSKNTNVTLPSRGEYSNHSKVVSQGKHRYNDEPYDDPFGKEEEMGEEEEQVDATEWGGGSESYSFLSGGSNNHNKNKSSNNSSNNNNSSTNPSHQSNQTKNQTPKSKKANKTGQQGKNSNQGGKNQHSSNNNNNKQQSSSSSSMSSDSGGKGSTTGVRSSATSQNTSTNPNPSSSSSSSPHSSKQIKQDNTSHKGGNHSSQRGGSSGGGNGHHTKSNSARGSRGGR